MRSASYRALIDSARVASSTRAALLGRDGPDDPGYRPVAMSVAQFRVLRAVVERVIPQEAEGAIDLAARMDAALGAGQRDGWRFAELPGDAEAYRAGLDTLDRMAGDAMAGDAMAGGAGSGSGAFAELDGAARDGVLRAVADGTCGEGLGGGHGLTERQMALWFEDLRADAVDMYVNHPDTLARIGYSGVANGGDGPRKSGFVRVGLGETEEWEPVGEGPG